ncbi:uncharacterized protein LTR77_005537 [Saxophila tyrrhenica]|uniref:Uncharacterized protein n=1 Tax=Saxophila tyrrhenica TaxID=1690608 RepID=A0AAV9P8Q8_9PEZI|nr:hypothetical protein LTR77_005537 [Saxophila tyrrhenica]
MSRHPSSNPSPQRYSYSTPSTSPILPFLSPSARRRSVITETQEANIDDQTNKLLGKCVDWRKHYHVYKSPKKFGKSRLEKLEEEREGLITQANGYAAMLSRRRGHEVATELVRQIKANLILPGYVLSKEAACLVRFWETVTGDIKEQVQQLKVIRYELALVMIMEKYINVDDVNMLNCHQPIYHRGDMLRFSTLASEHRRRVQDRFGYRIEFLAEQDAKEFIDRLDQRFRDGGNMKALNAYEESGLLVAFRLHMRRGLTVQEQLANDGRIQPASMLLMTKAAIVLHAGATLGLHEPVETARAVIDDFVRKQNFLSLTEIMQAGQQQLEHVMSEYPDRSIWPDL